MLRAQCEALEADLVAARATVDGARSLPGNAARTSLSFAYAFACAVWIVLGGLVLGATERAPVTTLAAVAGWIVLVRLAVGTGMLAFRKVSGVDDRYTRTVILFYLPMAFVPFVGFCIALWRAAVLVRGHFAPWTSAGTETSTPQEYPALRVGRAGAPLALTFAAIAAMQVVGSWVMVRS